MHILNIHYRYKIEYSTNSKHKPHFFFMLVTKRQNSSIKKKQKLEESICNFFPQRCNQQQMYFATEIPVVQRTERCILLFR